MCIAAINRSTSYYCKLHNNASCHSALNLEQRCNNAFACSLARPTLAHILSVLYTINDFKIGQIVQINKIKTLLAATSSSSIGENCRAVFVPGLYTNFIQQQQLFWKTLCALYIHEYISSKVWEKLGRTLCVGREASK